MNKQQFSLEHGFISNAGKKYKLDPESTKDIPKVTANFVQIATDGEFFTLVFGLRQDSMAVESELVEAQAVVYITPAMAEQLVMGMQASLKQMEERLAKQLNKGL